MCKKMKVALIIFLVLASSASLAREFTQNGNSMSPTIDHGESVEVGIVSAFFYEPKRWDIVIFSNPNGQMNGLIGRIVGMPNEKIFIDESGLHINSRLMLLPKKMRKAGIHYLPPNKTMASALYKNNREYQTGSSEFFILGDNSFAARDSRFFGPVHRDEIANKVENR